MDTIHTLGLMSIYQLYTDTNYSDGAYCMYVTHIKLTCTHAQYSRGTCIVYSECSLIRHNSFSKYMED